MKKKLFWLIPALIATQPLVAQSENVAQSSPQAACPEVRIETEQLPNLNIPRAGHNVFSVYDEIVVAGGHTNGFVPTPTAEYYKDGEWHVMQMVYPHDNGFSVMLSSGKVLLGGGHNEPIGIGQTYLVELYDPMTHTFDGFGSMECKRALASALELDSGQVIIAGNWYHDDGIELFDGSRKFTYVKDVSIGRARPYLFRLAGGDALILGNTGIHGDTITSSVAECLKGEPFHIPLLETWHPLFTDHQRSSDACIGDEAKGEYIYLMAVEDSCGQVAIAKVEGTNLSLLPTDYPIPLWSHGEQIEYILPVIVDKQAQRAYLIGLNKAFHQSVSNAKRWYVLSIDYTQTPAALTLCYTDPLPKLNLGYPVITNEGNILMTGGLSDNSNFYPTNSVVLLRVGAAEKFAAKQSSFCVWCIILLIVGILLVILFVFLFITRRKKKQASDIQPDTIEPDASAILMRRISKAMENQRFYQNSDLKLSDLAAVLGTNRRFISDCINSQQGCSFTQYVNNYRIKHAKRLLRQNPDKKITDVYIESGFANETSFFRTFKSVTGMTPREWLNSKNN